MLIETNLDKIKKTAEKKEDENWEFRSFLKGYCDLPSGKIDRVVYELFEKVSSVIDCTRCGNCCKEVKPILKRADIRRLAGELAISTKQFIYLHLNREKEEEGFVFKEDLCPFIEDKKCKYYASRPDDCKSFPHLHKKGFVFRLMGVIGNYTICPIVFSVYEQLKDELWRSKRRKNG